MIGRRKKIERIAEVIWDNEGGCWMMKNKLGWESGLPRGDGK
jgi:hypothetical protein